MATNVEFDLLNNIKDFISHKYFRYVLYLPAIILLYALTKKWFIYSVFVGLTAIIIYYTKLYHIPIDVSPLFFLEIVITRYFGLQFTLLYVFLAYIIPKTFAGSNMKFDSYVFISISMVANAFALLFPTMPLLTVGLITSVIQYVGGIMFSMTMKPFFMAAADGIANVLNNLLWFLIFSDLIVMLF